VVAAHPADHGAGSAGADRQALSILWLLPIGVVGLIIGIAVCQQLRTYPAVQSWIASHPGTGDFQPPVTSGFPLWLRILHFLNLLFMLFIIRAGIQILADHPRLQTDAGSEPGKEWLRLRGPVPPDRIGQEPPERAWTAKMMRSPCPGGSASRGFGTRSDWPAGGTSAPTCCGS
jgi:hypothetical protein